ncbi:MAG: hypothetical protein JWM80_2710 [Cyanobacteria bacterium RYN_339]|nr:hypothetical protein [Cyanobacteria bacterium RYN_339]
MSPARPGGATRTRRATAELQVPPNRLDLYHMLSAVVGAYVGLVFYSLITPGQIPHEPPLPTPDPRTEVRLTHVKGLPGPDGLYHVAGEVKNLKDRSCRLASVSVRFLDKAGNEVTRTLATVERIPSGAAKPFDVRAMAAGAVSFEAAVDLAQY